MRSKWRSIAAGLTLAAAATVGTLTAAGPASADTGWGASVDSGSTTTVTTPVTTVSGSVTGGVSIQPSDTGWG